MKLFDEAFGAMRYAREWGAAAPRYNGDFAYGPDAQESVVFGVFGDSVGCGLGASHVDRTFAGEVARRLAGDKRVVCRIKAVSGARSRDLAKQPAGGDERFAVISIGTNDIIKGESFEDMERELVRFLESLRHAQTVLVIGPGDVAASSIVPFLLRGWVRRKVVACEAALKRAVARFPNARHFGPSELSVKMTADDYAPDGFHPNERAHATIADLVFARLVP